MNKAALLGVEYGFHVPLIVAPLTLIWAFRRAAAVGRSAGRP
jgi:hypothetical protein